MDAFFHSAWAVLRSLLIVITGVYLGISTLVFLFQARLVYYPLKDIAGTPETVGLPYEAVVFETEEQLVRSTEELNKYGVFPRRYFYPSLDTLNYVPEQCCSVSRSIAQRILCLAL